MKVLGFEVLTAAVLTVSVFWDIAPCSLYVDECFGGTYHLDPQGRKSTEQETSLQQVARLLIFVQNPAR
jgi:hypothetical protein